MNASSAKSARPHIGVFLKKTRHKAGWETAKNAGEGGSIHYAQARRQTGQARSYFAGAVDADESALVQMSHKETGTRPMSTANTQVAEIRQTPATSRSKITCRFDKLNGVRVLREALCGMNIER